MRNLLRSKKSGASNKTEVASIEASSLVSQISGQSIREIDHLIEGLEGVRKKLDDEGDRIQQVADTFIKRYVEAEKKLRTKDEIVRLLNTPVFPHWADRPFRDLKRGDVADLLDLIQDNHGARQADKALAIIRKLMNWYATRHDDYVSVIVRGRGALRRQQPQTQTHAQQR